MGLDGTIERRRAELARDYQAVFGSEAGQRVFADLMAAAGVDEDIFADSARVTAYRAGRRSLALRIRNFYNLKFNDKEPERMTQNERR